MQNWTDEYLQHIVDITSQNDDFKSSQILKLKLSSIERMLREARSRGLAPSKEFDPGKPNVLIIDIETSLMTFYAWSPGKQYVGPDQIITDWYTLGWACKWLYEAEVYSDILTADESLARNDERIIRTAWEFLDKADILIIHNARFDVRKLNARFIYYDMPPPSPYKVIDTLLIMRKEALFSSNKQDELCKKLGLRRKVEHEGYNLWIRCFNGDPEALLIMQEYNKGDIVGLEDLYSRIRPYIKSHPNMALYVDGNGYSCPCCGSTKIEWMDKFYDTNVNRYSCFRCECGAIGRSRVSALTKDEKPQIISIAK